LLLIFDCDWKCSTAMARTEKIRATCDGYVITSLFPPYAESGYEQVAAGIADQLVGLGVEVAVLTTKRGTKRQMGIHTSGQGRPVSINFDLRSIRCSRWQSLLAELRNFCTTYRTMRKMRPRWVTIWSIALIGPVPVFAAALAGIPVIFVLLD